MKTGRTLTELAQEIERQRASKRDFLADTRALRMQENGALSITDAALTLPASDITHRQIGEHVKIPAAYYDRMQKEAPDLLATNVNRWFDKYPATRMVRTLDDRARAFMSNSYRPLDNAELMEAALPPLMKLGVEVISCEVTERKLYLKVVDKRILRDLKGGAALGQGHDRFDTASPALVLSNSEVGFGALAVETSVWTHGCTNLMVISERSHRRTHLGARSELTGEETYAMLSDTTKRLTDQALWAQIGDVVTAAFERAQFDSICEKLEATAGNMIEGDPLKTVELVAKTFAMTDGERGSVLRHLIASGNLSQYGVHAAVTRAAEDLDDYDRASEFEKFGGKIVELPKREWQEFALAA